jgi:2-methylcitrate dehydratase PrpD
MRGEHRLRPSDIEQVSARVNPIVMESYVTIRVIGGRSLEKHVPSALGSVERPMSDHDLEAKFLALVEKVFPTELADQLIAVCWSAEQFEDASSISRLCGASQPI